MFCSYPARSEASEGSSPYSFTPSKLHSIDPERKISKKIKVQVQDLNYQVPLKTIVHQAQGFLEFDPAYLLRFKNTSENTGFIDLDEISQILSKELSNTTIEFK